MSEHDKIMKAYVEQSLKNQVEIIELLKSMDWKLWETLKASQGESNGSSSSSVDGK